MDCQIKAWKAGHKGKCLADQERVLQELNQLAAAADWRGVAAQERSFTAVAAAVPDFDAGNRSVCLWCLRDCV